MKGPITGLDIGQISKKRLKKLAKIRRKQEHRAYKQWRKDIRKRQRRVEKDEYERTHVSLTGKKVRWKKCPQKGCTNRVPVLLKSSQVVACGLCTMRLALGRIKDRFDDHSPTQRRKVKEWYEIYHPKYKSLKKNLKKRQKQMIKRRKRAEFLRAQRTLRKQRDNFMLLVQHRSKALQREPRDD